MARNRGKMSLYEVMGQSKSKSKYDKALKKLATVKTDKDEPTAVKTTVLVSERATHWPRKPKLLQFNAGRIEISLPYPLAITVFLGFILLFLVAIWLGEISYIKRKGITNSAGSVFNGLRKKVGGGLAGTGGRVGENENILTNKEDIEIVGSKGNNRIVIQTYDKRADLELVQIHFSEGNINTEIIQRGDTFYLLSADKYEKDPKIEGTDGYAAKQKIIEWGVRYKAPQGYEPFGAKSFKTAHGMKFDD